jgi:hypothetical protein
VAGYEEDKGLAGARPWPIRPHWWLVLAVSLALLALVAATTSDHPGSSGRHHSARSLRLAPGPTRPTPTTTSTTAPVTTTTVTTPTSAVDVPTSPVRGSDIITQSSTSAAPTTTTTTTTTAVTTTTSALAAAPTQPPQPAASDIDYSYTLQQPSVPAASYTFYGVGSMTVTAKWDYATPLSFTVTCPGGAKTEVGTTPLTIVIPNAGGPCDTSLKETLVQYNPVDFVILIYPTGG